MKKVIYAALVLLVVGIAGTIVSANKNGGFSLNTVDVFQSKKISATDIKNMEIETASTDVTILPGNEDAFQVVLKGKASEKLKKSFTLIAVKNGDTVIIRVKRKNEFSIGFNFEQVHLEVKIPKKEMASIAAKTSSGDIHANGLQSEQASFAASSGDISGEAWKIKNELKVHTSSGDISMNGIDSGTADFLSASGDMELKKLKEDTITLETSSGDAAMMDVRGNITANATQGISRSKMKNLKGI